MMRITRNVFLPLLVLIVLEQVVVEANGGNNDDDAEPPFDAVAGFGLDETPDATVVAPLSSPSSSSASPPPPSGHETALVGSTPGATAFDASFAKMLHSDEDEDDSATIDGSLSPPSAETSNNPAADAPRCGDLHATPTFVRHVGAVAQHSIAKLRREGISLAECATSCRDRLSPLDVDTSFDCDGFAFNATAPTSCDFYDAHSFDVIPLPTNARFDSPSQSPPPPPTTHYLERACLRLPNGCSNHIHAFEAYIDRGVSWAVTPLTRQAVASRVACLELCLNHPACMSINHHRQNASCELLGQFIKQESLVESVGTDFYENSCRRLVERPRCESDQRADLVVTRNLASAADAAGGLRLAVGGRSIANCERECLASTFLVCRAFLYEPATRLCTLLEAVPEPIVTSSSSSSVTSNHSMPIHDLYEPICASATVDLPCVGDAAFERLARTNLLSEEVIATLKDVSLSLCLDAALFETSSRAFTYSRADRRCKILPYGRQHPRTRSVVEGEQQRALSIDSNSQSFSVGIDLYELACDRNAVLRDSTAAVVRVTPQAVGAASSSSITTSATSPTPSPPSSATSDSTTVGARQLCDLRASTLLAHGRVHRLSYRNLHHVNVGHVEQCEGLCTAASQRCASFAFNRATGDCLLSETRVARNLLIFTQLNANYDLYAYLGAVACIHGTTLDVTSDPTSTTTRHFSTLPPALRHSVAAFSAAMIAHQHHHEAAHDPFESTPTTTAAAISRPSPPTPAPLIDRVSIGVSRAKAALSHDDHHHETPIMTSLSTPPPTSTFAAPSTGALPFRDPAHTRLEAANVRVTATCLDRGVQVEFAVLGDTLYTGECKHTDFSDIIYPGAVYASERFESCRQFVESSDRFSLFITRPSVENQCNALEEDATLTAILIVSNDGVSPFDVTTKDDLYYHLQCSYSDANEASSVVRAGIVVGGPEPKSLHGSAKKAEEMQNRVILKLLKNGAPVTSVYIGERLTAAFESHVDASRLRVSECNATRVGGHGPRRPNTALIRNGCSLMPQVMSDIVRVAGGLEASFTAFRIDGSDQIDIVCSIVVCRHRCDEKDPPCSSMQPQQRTRRHDTDEFIDNDHITVDQRLRVLVDDADEAANIEKTTTHTPPPPLSPPSHGLLTILQMDATATDYCLSTFGLLLLLALFLVCLLALAVSLAYHVCRDRNGSHMPAAYWNPPPTTSRFY